MIAAGSCSNISQLDEEVREIDEGSTVMGKTGTDCVTLRPVSVVPISEAHDHISPPPELL